MEKGKRDAELKKQELEIRKAEVEAGKNRHDEMAQSQNNLITIMSEQNRMMLELMKKLVGNQN